MTDILLGSLDQEKDKDGIISQNESCEFIGLNYIRAYNIQRGINIKIARPINIPTIASENPRIVGFSVMASNYIPTRRLSKKLKKIKPRLKIVWGGPHATVHYTESLKAQEVDYIVLGEGEKTSFELFSRLLEDKPIKSVKGIAFYDGSKVITTPQRSRLTSKEIDSIKPKILHPKRDYKLSFAKHIPHSVPASEMRFAIINGSRGCWNNCSFCSSKSLWERSITYRSPQSIVDELEYLVKEQRKNFIFFSDDDFLVNSKRTEEICQRIIKRGIKIKLHVMASVKSSSRFANYDLLRQAGIREITIGMETTNQKLIDSMRKGYDINELPKVANEITGHKIHLGLYYMLGYPGQTQEDLKKDYEFIKQIPFSRIRAVFATPYPGTALYQQVEKENLWLKGCRNNWSVLTNDRPVIKTPAAQEHLIKARKRVLRLYFSQSYEKRMKKMLFEDMQGQKAYKEFRQFIKEVLR